MYKTSEDYLDASHIEQTVHGIALMEQLLW